MGATGSKGHVDVSPHFRELADRPGFVESVERGFMTRGFVASLLALPGSFGDDVAKACEFSLSSEDRGAAGERVRAFERLLAGGITEEKQKRVTAERTIEELAACLPEAPAHTRTTEARAALFAACAPLVAAQRRAATLPFTKRSLCAEEPGLALKEVVLYALACVVGAADFGAPGAAAGAAAPLESLRAMIADFGPRSFFPEWSPPRVPAERAVPLAGAAASASSVEGSNAASNALDARGGLAWLTAARPNKPSWEVTLPAPAAVTSLRLVWVPGATPRRVRVSVKLAAPPVAGSGGAPEAAPDAAGGDGDELMTVAAVDVGSEEVTRVPVHGYCVSRIVLSFEGFARANGDSKLGLSQVEVLMADAGRAVVSPLEVLANLRVWLLGVSRSPEVLGTVTAALTSLAMASGSLVELLHLVQFLLGGAPGDGGGGGALDEEGAAQAAGVVKVLHDEVDTMREVAARLMVEPAAPAAVRGVVDASFDPSAGSPDNEYSRGNKFVISRNPANTLAVLDCCFSSGKAVWTFRLEEDSNGGECTCFGALTKPITVMSYNAANCWMYRCYNGQLYGTGAQGSPKRKIHPHDTIRVELDLDAGTLSYRVNEEEVGVCFTGVAGTIWPAVGFYSSTRSVSIVSVERLSGETPSGAGATGAARTHAGVVAAAAPVAEPESEDDTPDMADLRRRFPGAIQLAEITCMPLEVCVRALEANGGNPDGAAEWLFTHSEEQSAAQEALEKRRDERRARKAKRAAEKAGGGAAAAAAAPAAAAELAAAAEPVKEVELVAVDTAPTSRTAFAASIMARLAALSAPFVDAAAETPRAPGEARAVSLDEPYCIQACGAAFALLADLLSTLAEVATPPSAGRPMSTHEGMVLSALSLVRANLHRLVFAHVQPSDVGIDVDGDEPTLEALHGLLETIMAGAYRVELQIAAVEAIQTGLPVLYGSARARAELLRQLVSRHMSTPFPRESPSYILLERLLRRFCSPAGVVPLLPPETGAVRADHSTQIADLLSTLFSVLVAESKRGLGAVGGGAAVVAQDDMVLTSGLQLLAAYQRHLVCLCANNIGPTQPPCSVLRKYARLLTVNACEVVEAAQVLLSSRAADSDGARRAHVDAGVRASIVGTLLPSFLTSVVLLAKHMWLASDFLPPLVALVERIDMLNSHMSMVSQAEGQLVRQSSSQISRRAGGDAQYKFSDVVEDLPFEVHSVTAGNEIRGEHGAARVLEPGPSVFCTADGCVNCNVVLKYRGVGPFRLEEVSVTSPPRPFTAPIADGLVFVFPTLRGMETTAYYNDMTRKQFDSMRPSDPRDVAQPVAFFGLTAASETVVVRPKVVADGMYVVVKLVRAQEGPNIDVQQIVLRGHRSLESVVPQDGAAYRGYVTVDGDRCDVALRMFTKGEAVEGTGTIFSVVGPVKTVRVAGSSKGTAKGAVHKYEVAVVQEGKEGGIVEEGKATEASVLVLVGAVSATGAISGACAPKGVEGAAGSFCIWTAPGESDASDLRLPWLLDLQKTAASLGGRMAGAMVTGPPCSLEELELAPYLTGALLSGGLPASSEAASAAPDTALASPDYGVSMDCLVWSKEVEGLRLKASGGGGGGGGKWADATKRVTEDLRGNAEAECQEFMRRVLAEGTGKGSLGMVLLDWLDTNQPETAIARRRGVFPDVELPVLCALLKHADIWREALGTAELLRGGASPESVPVSHDMNEVWKRVTALRGHLRLQKKQLQRGEDSLVATPEAAEAEDAAARGPSSRVRRSKRTFQIPRSMEQLCTQLQDRAAFVMSLAPCRVSSELASLASQSQLAEKWSDMLPRSTLQPLLARWKSSERMSGDTTRWSGMVNVLRRQHSWTRKSSHAEADHSGSDASGDEKDDELPTPFQLTLMEVTKYITEGIGAPPAMLRSLLALRKRRALCRRFGLDALRALLGATSVASAHADALVWLRPALRGIEETEADDSDTRASWTLRRHYLQHLEGCNGVTLDQVQASFVMLYTHLAELLNMAVSGADATLSHVVLWTWGCDLEARDHEFVLRVNLVPALKSMLSFVSRGCAAEQMVRECNASEFQQQSPTALRDVWTVDRVVTGLMNGSLTKREVVFHMKFVAGGPAGSALPPEFWTSTQLNRSLRECTASISVADLVAAYESFYSYVSAFSYDDYMAAQADAMLARFLLKVRVTDAVQVISVPVVAAGGRLAAAVCRELGRSPGTVKLFIPGAGGEVALDGTLTDETMAALKGGMVVRVEKCVRASGAVIRDIVSKSTRPYELGHSVQKGARAFTDIASTYMKLAPDVDGCSYLLVPDGDKASVDPTVPLVTCVANAQIKVWVAVSSSVVRPPWVSADYTKSSAVVNVEGLPEAFALWESNRVYHSGDLLRFSTGAGKPYFVFFKRDVAGARNPTVIPWPKLAGMDDYAVLRNSAWVLYKLMTTLSLGGAQGRRSEELGLSTEVAPGVGQVVLAQTLRYSLELQRIAFEVIEQEVLFGTSVLAGSVTAGETVSYLDAVEVEAILYNQLLFWFSMVNTQPGKLHVAKPTVLHTLLRLLAVGSPRLRRVVLRLLREAIPETAPSVVDAALEKALEKSTVERLRHLDGSAPLFLTLLMDLMGLGTAAVESGEPFGGGRPIADDLRRTPGYGSGFIAQSLAAEVCALLRMLLGSNAWHNHVSDMLSSCIVDAKTIVAVLTADAPVSEDTRQTFVRAACALAVLGGASAGLRVGSRVSMSHDARGSVDGRLVEFSHSEAKALVAFGDSINQEPTQVACERLVPLDDVPLDPSTFPLPDIVIGVLSDWISLPLRGATSLHGIWVKQLRTMSIAALRSLLSDDYSAGKAVAAGMVDKLYTISLQQVALPTFVALSRLESRRLHLEARLFEVLRGSVCVGAAGGAGAEDGAAGGRAAGGARRVIIGGDEKTMEPEAESKDGGVEVVRAGVGSHPEERWARARALFDRTKFPVPLCVSLLQACGDDGERAAGLVDSHGAKWLKTTPYWCFGAIVALSGRQVYLVLDLSAPKEKAAAAAKFLVKVVALDAAGAAAEAASELVTVQFALATRSLKLKCAGSSNKELLDNDEYDLVLSPSYMELTGTVKSKGGVVTELSLALMPDGWCDTDALLDDSAPLEDLGATVGAAMTQELSAEAGESALYAKEPRAEASSGALGPDNMTLTPLRDSVGGGGGDASDASVVRADFRIDSTPSSGQHFGVGFATRDCPLNKYLGNDTNGYVMINDGRRGNGSSWNPYVTGRTFTIGDVIGVEHDRVHGTIRFYWNGDDCGVAWSGLADRELFPAVTFANDGDTVSIVASSPVAYTWEPEKCGGFEVSDARRCIRLPVKNTSGTSAIASGVASSGVDPRFGDFMKLRRANEAPSVVRKRMRDTGFSASEVDEFTAAAEAEEEEQHVARVGKDHLTPDNSLSVFAERIDPSRAGAADFRGETCKCVVLEPPAGGSMTAAFKLDSRWSVFEARVALADSTTRAASPVVFELRGDGLLLWRSRELVEARQVDHCRVFVFTVGVLELSAGCAGEAGGVQALFVDPRVGGDGAAALTPGMPLAISTRESTAMQRADGVELVSGPVTIGTLVSAFRAPSGGVNDVVVRLRFLDEERGLARVRDMPIDVVRRVTHMFGSPIGSVAAIRGLLGECYDALSSHYARHAMLSLLENWPARVPFGLAAVGGAQRYVSLVKLVAASESALSKRVDASADAPPGSQCRIVTVLRSKLRDLLEVEVRDRERALSEVLVSECVHNFVASTTHTDSVLVESLHPLAGYGRVRDRVVVPGASTLRIAFDGRSALGKDGVLAFYSSPSYAREAVVAQVRAKDVASAFVSVVGDQVWWELTPPAGDLPGDLPWGFMFRVTPLCGKWTCEAQVLRDPSLEWASWLMDFVLNDAAAVLGRGAVHNASMFDALVRLLRTRAGDAGTKAIVINLLTQLLSQPGMFPPESPPALASLLEVQNRVLARCTGPYSSAAPNFQPARLVQLVELVMMRETAAAALAPARGDAAAECRLELEVVGLVPTPPLRGAHPASVDVAGAVAMFRDAYPECASFASDACADRVEEFGTMDEAGTGFIDRGAWLANAARAGGDTDEESVLRMFTAMDFDGKGYVDVFDYLYSRWLEETGHIEYLTRRAGMGDETDDSEAPPHEAPAPCRVTRPWLASVLAHAWLDVGRLRVLSPASPLPVHDVRPVCHGLRYGGAAKLGANMTARAVVGAPGAAGPGTRGAIVLLRAGGVAAALPFAMAGAAAVVVVAAEGAAPRAGDRAAAEASPVPILLVSPAGGDAIAAAVAAGERRSAAATEAKAGDGGHEERKGGEAAPAAPPPAAAIGRLARSLSAELAERPVVPTLMKAAPTFLDDLNDVGRVVDAMFHHRRVPDAVACHVWAEAKHVTRTIGSSHPYRAGEVVSGEIVVPGATGLVVWLHPLCSTSPGTRLVIESGAGHVFEGPTNDGTPPKERWDKGAVARVTHAGGKLKYSFVVPEDDANAGGLWGFEMMVVAAGVGRDALLSAMTERIDDVTAEAAALSAGWTRSMDAELVDLVRAAATGAADSCALPPSRLVLATRNDRLRYQNLSAVPPTQLRARYVLLALLNTRLRKLLPFIDMSAQHAWSVGCRLRTLGHCIFHDVKTRLLEQALDATRGTGAVRAPALMLDNFKASMSSAAGENDPATSKCVFVQAFEQLRACKPEAFRVCADSSDRVFTVNFKNESGVDAGGVYREGLQRMIEDLFSTRFNLFVQCPNAVHRSGDNLGSYVPNPRHKTPLAIEMLEFVGVLMGMSLRFKASLPFMCPSIMWKPLVGQPLTEDDISAMDMLYGQMIHAIRHCDRDYSLDAKPHPPITSDDAFEAAFPEMYFVTNASTGEVVELVPGGAKTRLTFSNRLRFCDLVVQYRLHEFDVQVAAIRRGLGRVVPLRALRLLTVTELEVLVAGSPLIDLDVLKAHTDYDGYTKDDPVVKRFWAVFASLSDDERSKYVRFAWGRSRLPAGAAWSNRHAITRLSGDRPDRLLPHSHTCFFRIDLPAYTTEERMRWGLLTALHFGSEGVLNT